MSVVGGATRRRWLSVAAGIAVLVAAPGVTGWASAALGDLSAPEPPAPRALLDAALHSTGVRFQGLAESRGTLGLPDVPVFGSVAALLGQTTRMRVWWSTPTAWRVDTLSGTGEVGTYGRGDQVLVWDYERREVSTGPGAPPVRLPRADDLLPPQGARRLLGDLAPDDRVTAIGSRQVAGRHADGIRVVPADRRSTVGRVDLWVDRTGLPLAIEANDRTGTQALTSSFGQISFDRPGDRVLTPPDPPGTHRETTTGSDVQRLLDQQVPWVLPATLAGLPASAVDLGGAASYGRGLVRVLVLPVDGGLARRLRRDAVRAGAVRLNLPGARAVLTTSSVLNSVVLGGPDREHAYVLAGLVTPDLLEQMAAELVAHPPARSEP
jgi:hypothetical protein